MGFEIGQAVIIGIFLGWMGSDKVGFGGKLCKEEIPIAKAEKWPFLGGREDKHISWCFDMGESIAWGRQRLEAEISKAPGNKKKKIRAF